MGESEPLGGRRRSLGIDPGSNRARERQRLTSSLGAALEALEAPVATLSGMAPRHVPLVTRAAGSRVIDLLWHLPFSIIDRRLTTIANATLGSMATLKVTVVEYRLARSRGRPSRVHVKDDTGSLDITYFNMPAAHTTRLFPLGETRYISGKLESYDGFYQMAHPDLVLRENQMNDVGGLRPVYRTTAGLPASALESYIRTALQHAPEIPEWIDAALLRREGWPSWLEALRLVHAPERAEDLEPASLARQRLAFDELLFNQLTLGILRHKQTRLGGRANRGDGVFRDKALAKLGFKLTPSQLGACSEIAGDMGAPRRMMRLLQGDVGSGKTVVALMAMLQAVEAGGQAALMAPTEILARQHWLTMEPVLRTIGVEGALLLGQGRGQNRAPILHGLKTGGIALVVGTHALVQSSVEFADLRLAVIDEQHRFGVDHRVDLSAKGAQVDTLLMTATPIPRTLTLTAYGDLDISRLTEKPPGRQSIDTRTISLDRLDEVLAGIRRKIEDGSRVYWVCPLVEETETSDMAAARQRAVELSAIFGAERVGLIHGRMKSAEKAGAMEAFASGRLSILVATTVIEVGVNVPEATVMVIEHAERYGLSQLHQLRGRVGRGSDKSVCLLLYTPNPGATAIERLNIIRSSENGFYLAEEDLRLRGTGEVLGTRQSGLPDFRLVDPAAHLEMVPVAHDAARLLLEHSEASLPSAIDALLTLFDIVSGLNYARSG